MTAAATFNVGSNIAYSGASYRMSHPRRLEALAALSGMHPQPLPAARVLELGCASGRNLLPQAANYADAEFVGVDFSGRQIAEGQAMIKALGIDNIRLHEARIEDVDGSWGVFDYILCHGVYSWVNPGVEDDILAICQRNLAAQGVAYVSYNVLPGWHVRNITRDLMRYHTDGIESATEKIVRARAILGFMGKNAPGNSAYKALLAEEVNSVQRSDDAYLNYEFLQNDNHPCYFHEFIERAASHGLQYLGDANTARLSIRAAPQEAQAALANLPLLKQQQYMDFLLNTSFRRTVLCHDHIRLERRRTGNLLDRFHIALSGRPQKKLRLDVTSKEPVDIALGNNTISSNSPFAKAAIQHLIDVFPGSVMISDLHKAAIALLEGVGYPLSDEPATRLEDMAAVVMEVYLGGAIELSLHPPKVASTVSDLPAASPLARLQASTHGKVVSQLHETIVLDEFKRQVVSRLDGERDPDSLWLELARAIDRGEIEVDSNSMESLDDILEWCRERALLIE